MEAELDLGDRSEWIRVERDPTLCEHLNRDVGNIVALDIYFPRHICVLHVLEH